MYEKCLGCHEYEFNQPEDGGKKLLFCSFTCMILAGYGSVKSDFVPKHTVEELSDSKELQDSLLNNYPVRVRDRCPCNCHHTKEQREEMQRNAFR